MDTSSKKDRLGHAEVADIRDCSEDARIEVDVEAREEVDVIVKDGEVDIRVEDDEGNATTVIVHTAPHKGSHGEHGHGEHGHGEHGEHGHGEHGGGHHEHKPEPCVEEISVNENPVPIRAHEASGLVIKQAAIAAGVAIELNFVLAEERSDGTSKIIGDDDVIKLHCGMQFSAIRDDDNS